MIDINPINPQSITINVPSNGSLAVSTNADAQLAYSWACGVGLIQGIDYSAKYWAGKAKESELIAVNAIQGVEDAKDDAIAELESAKDTCLNDIELAGDNKVAEIEGLASDYESTLIALTARAETAADAAEGYAQQAEQAKDDIEAELDNYVQTSRQINGKDLTNDITLTSSDIGALSDTTKYGYSIALSLNTTNYKLTLTLKDQDGTALSTKTVDFPIESVVVNGSYDSTNQKIVLTLQSGSTIDIPVGDLISGLQSEITSTNKLDADLVDDTNSSHKFATAAQLSQIATNTSSISNLATVATSGSYNDLSNKPTIPAAQVQADWNVTDTTSKAYIKNKPYIPSGVVVDQTFDGTSQNSQSGVGIQSELSTNYQSKLVSGTNIKTINNTSLLGSGNISLAEDDTTISKNSDDELQTIGVIDDNVQNAYNFTVVGSPTITADGIASGFSNINRIYVSNIEFLKGDNWKIYCPLPKGQTGIAGLFAIAGMCIQIVYTPEKKTINYNLSSTGSTWDIASGQSFIASNLDITKEALYVLEFTGTQYKSYILQNNQIVGSATDITNSNKLYYDNTTTFILGNNRNANAPTNGSIDLKQFSITVDGVEVYRAWQPPALKYWTGTKAQYDAIVTKDANTLYNITDDSNPTLSMLEFLYPIGSIYIGTMSACPLQTLGVGTWQLVATDRVLQGAGTRGSVGSTVNESLPNIKGQTGGGFRNFGNANWGALYGEYSYNTAPVDGNYTGLTNLKFDASRSSSTYQDNAPVQQDAYLVNIWERIS